MTHIHVHVIWPESFLQVCKKNLKTVGRRQEGICQPEWRQYAECVTSFISYQLLCDTADVSDIRAITFRQEVNQSVFVRSIFQFKVTDRVHVNKTGYIILLSISYFPAITNEGEKSLFEVQFWYTHDFYYHHFSNIKYSQFSNLYTFTRNWIYFLQ